MTGHDESDDPGRTLIRQMLVDRDEAIESATALLRERIAVLEAQRKLDVDTFTQRHVDQDRRIAELEAEIRALHQLVYPRG